VPENWGGNSHFPLPLPFPLLKFTPHGGGVPNALAQESIANENVTKIKGTSLCSFH